MISATKRIKLNEFPERDKFWKQNCKFFPDAGQEIKVVEIRGKLFYILEQIQTPDPWDYVNMYTARIVLAGHQTGYAVNSITQPFRPGLDYYIAELHGVYGYNHNIDQARDWVKANCFTRNQVLLNRTLLNSEFVTKALENQKFVTKALQDYNYERWRRFFQVLADVMDQARLR